ncbi:MAG: ABC transporter ATP-binding protein [Deltaproteobacteria bacterium]|nr:ABC transporter ATP-binding protein [Deltaproteobacteria bacterium]
MSPAGDATAATPIVRARGLERIYFAGERSTEADSATDGSPRAAEEISVHALRGVDLTIGPGEYVAIMGPSGCGKSTLLNILGCLDRPTSGSYELAGRDVARLSADERAVVRNRTLGFVFQDFHLLPRTTALENVELPLVYRPDATSGQRERARAALARVGLAGREWSTPRELSGGQQQRVAIARALVGEPSLLLADEPTGNLDSDTGREILALLDDLHARGLTIVLVTHDADVAARAERVIRMRDGRIATDESRVRKEAR